MAGRNVCIYVDANWWENFKQACQIEGKRPNAVIRNFVERYSQETLNLEECLEYRIAKAMVEAKRIVQGKTSAKRADDLLKEI